MYRLVKTTLALSMVAALATPVSAQDRAPIVQQLRAELARLLKKEVNQLPVDKPVAGLGADELTVIEWQMAAEKAFRVDIADEKLFDKEPKKDLAIRQDLSISSMAGIVATSTPWPKGKTK